MTARLASALHLETRLEKLNKIFIARKKVMNRESQLGKICAEADDLRRSRGKRCPPTAAPQHPSQTTSQNPQGRRGFLL
jgi:hypothetical protein